MLFFCILGIKYILLQLPFFKHRGKSICFWPTDIIYDLVCCWKGLLQQQSKLQTKLLVFISLLLCCGLAGLRWRTLQRITWRSRLSLHHSHELFLKEYSWLFSTNPHRLCCGGNDSECFYQYLCSRKVFPFCRVKVRKEEKRKTLQLPAFSRALMYRFLL